MNAKPQRRRRIWPWIAAVIAIVIVAIAVSNTLRQAGVTPTASPSTPTATSTAVADGAPTGCLGGSGRDAAMVLAAQAQAQQTTSGAVEVSAAFVRWLNQFPYPSSVDIASIEKGSLSAQAPTKDLAGFFATNPNLSGGLVKDGQTYYLSTLPGVWHVESASEGEVKASIGTALVIDGALSPTLKGSITVDVRWEDGRWKFVSSQGTRTTQDLFSIGAPFAAGC